MPKLTLTYDLDTECNVADIAVKSLDYAIAWAELGERLRQKVKYGEPEPGDLLEAYQNVREWMVEISEDRNLPEVE